MRRLRAKLPLTSPRTRLRPLAASDAPAFLEYHGRESIYRYLGHGPLDPPGASRLLQEWEADPTRLAIAIEQNASLIGDITLRFRRSSAKAPEQSELVEASLGYALHPDHQGTGLATEAVRAAIGAAFEAGVRRITADVFADAAGSSALLARIGFQHDGTDRAAVLAPDGQTWWDDERWSLLREDLPGPAPTMVRPGSPVPDPSTSSALIPSAGELPPWPSTPPAAGRVLLREVRSSDVPMAIELATDPYVPTIGSLSAGAGPEDALAWVHRQRGRYAEGSGYSFTVTDADSGAAVGTCGLWTRELGEGRASAGYSIVPSARGQGYAADALRALTAFGWSLADVHRIALLIEPWNTASIRTAERAGYQREGLLRSHSQIGGARRDMLIYAVVRDEGNG